MGMPSMGIYSYELYKIYDVDNIIRIGSCGSYTEDLNLLDVILVDKSYTEGNYALTLNNENVHIVNSSEKLNSIIEKTAQETNCKYKKGTVLCNEVFDSYMSDSSEFMKRIPDDIKPIGAEMEAFALFYNAKVLGKNAACLLTVVDDHYHKTLASSEEREKSLLQMIELALNSVE